MVKGAIVQAGEIGIRTVNESERNIRRGNLKSRKRQSRQQELLTARIKQRGEGFAATNRIAHRELARSGRGGARDGAYASVYAGAGAREAGMKGGVTDGKANREHMAAIEVESGGPGKRGSRKELSDAPSDLTDEDRCFSQRSHRRQRRILMRDLPVSWLAPRGQAARGQRSDYYSKKGTRTKLRLQEPLYSLAHRRRRWD